MYHKGLTNVFRRTTLILNSYISTPLSKAYLSDPTHANRSLMWFDTYGPLLLMHVNLILTTTIITMAEFYSKEDMSLVRPLPILPLVNSWLRPLLSFEMYNVHYL